jgi:hypothetical protein
MNLSLAMKSFTHEAKGLREGYAFLDHRAGTKFTARLSASASNSRDMTTSPLIASPILINDDLTSLSNLLNLSSSY